jgi:hypothetical protein
MLAVAAAVIATALLVALTFPAPLASAATIVLVGVVGVRAVRRLSRPPLLIHVGADRRIGVTTRDGRTRECSIHADTSVGAWITTIVWVPDGARWFAPVQTLLILPDSLPADDFRRLRVYLRHGRSTPDPDTSGVAAR